MGDLLNIKAVWSFQKIGWLALEAEDTAAGILVLWNK